MNWRRLYATLQILFTVCLASAVGAGCWSFLISGIFGMILKMGDDAALLSVGFPLFAVLFLVFLRYLPRSLRKAGMLSDDPKKFGPWLR